MNEHFYFQDAEGDNFRKFDEIVRLAPNPEVLLNAPPGEMNVLQRACNYGLDKYVQCLLEYPGI